MCASHKPPRCSCAAARLLLLAAASHMPIKMACEKQTEVDEYRIGRGRWTSIH